MPFDLTGVWQADDGGAYFVRQIDDLVWWLGLSTGGAFYPGLTFCNVYRGQIIQQLVYGEWSDVPRGATSNHGDMTLVYVDAADPGEQQLLKDVASGGFGGSSWQRVLNKPVVRSAHDLFEVTLKNVKNFQFLWWGGGNETLADNLQLIRDSASIFGIVKSWGSSDQRAKPVSVGISPERDWSYASFACLGDYDGDGDLTFFVLIDREQIALNQPHFFAGVDHQVEAEAQRKMLTPVEGEIIMYGRAAACFDPGRDDAAPLFPGWAEPSGSSPLFNGAPIPVQILPSGVGSNQPNFISAIGFEDPVRVTGALVFDVGHSERGLEVHPVYSVDVVSSTPSNDLSGAWADDHGNTYYLRHDPADNSVWYAGLSPLGSEAFGQVFRGAFDAGTATVRGNIVALSFGFESSVPPLGFSPTPLGDTGQVAFKLGSIQALNRTIPTLIVGSFRLLKLYDAPPLRREEI